MRVGNEGGGEGLAFLLFYLNTRRYTHDERTIHTKYEKHPQLTAHGYGVQRDPYLGPTYEEIFSHMREELKGSLEAFQSCLDWLDEHPDFKRGWSSYALKHEVENWMGTTGTRLYVSQGAFILAALHTGIPVKRIPDELGVFVG